MPTTTRIEWDIAASPDAVYRAPVDGGAVRTRMVPTGMTRRIHEFEACEGGRFRICLACDDPETAGVMRITETATGTLLRTEHDGVPDGVRPEDNELGRRISPGKSVAPVEDREIPA